MFNLGKIKIPLCQIVIKKSSLAGLKVWVFMAALLKADMSGWFILYNKIDDGDLLKKLQTFLKISLLTYQHYLAEIFGIIILKF